LRSNACTSHRRRGLVRRLFLSESLEVSGFPPFFSFELPNPAAAQCGQSVFLSPFFLFLPPPTVLPPIPAPPPSSLPQHYPLCPPLPTYPSLFSFLDLPFLHHFFSPPIPASWSSPAYPPPPLPPSRTSLLLPPTIRPPLPQSCNPSTPTLPLSSPTNTPLPTCFAPPFYLYPYSFPHP